MSVHTQSRPEPVYLMGFSAAERRRLIEQAALFRPFTERFLVAAGIGRGMRVLDVGCGVGDVSLLLAELVGPEGTVIGIDRDPRAIALARERGRDLPHVSFRRQDIQDLEPDVTFDAAVGRWVLLHVGDPVDAIRRVAGHVRAGGIVAFQDSDFSTMPLPAWPRLPLFERVTGWIHEALRYVGVHDRIGLSFRRLFAAAGLPAPELRMEVMLGGGPDFPGYRYVAEAVRSMLPLLEEFGVVTAAEADVETLADRLCAEAVAVEATLTLPPTVAAWTRTPVDASL